MRRGNGRRGAHLLVVTLLVLGVTIGGLEALVSPGTSPPPTSSAQAKARDQKPKRQKTRTVKKERRNRKALAALDSRRIAAENVDAGECGDLDAFTVGGRTYCTHGDDPPMFSRRARAAVTAEAAPALCIDRNASGPAVQLVYVYQQGKANDLPRLLPTFRRLASEMDVIVDQSARKTGGSLRLRFVTDRQCEVDVLAFGAARSDIGDWGRLIGAMAKAGYNRMDRKYLMLVDDTVYCGIASFVRNDDPATTRHDFTGYARVDRSCWDAGTMAHELAHTLGAVQASAPHTSQGGHCIDEWDVMCYSDQPHFPAMQTLCADGAQEFRFDCNNDDYFAANPAPGSYLANHWNMAKSIYFTPGAGPGCVDAALEPDDAYWYDFWGAPMRRFAVGASEARAFCAKPGDTDWILFKGQKGTAYQVETRDLAPGVDTQLVVYRGFEEQGWGGMTQIAANDDRAAGDPSSRVAFTAPATATYLVGVSEAASRAGYDLTYTLLVSDAASAGGERLSLSRNQAKPNQRFTATMNDVDPSSTITVWWQPDERQDPLGTMTASATGVASGDFTVPPDTRPGRYQVEAVASDNSVARASLKVVDKSKKAKKAKKGKKAKKRHKTKARRRGK